MKDQESTIVGESHVFGRDKGWLIVSIICFVAVILAVIIYFYCARRITNKTTSTENNAPIVKVTENTTTESGEKTASLPTPKSAADYYSDGTAQMAISQWSEAITNFDQAISLNQNDPNFYNKKSQAQYNLGQKDTAIKTLEDGIASNPTSDLLRSRLDVLQKEWYGDQPQ